MAELYDFWLQKIDLLFGTQNQQLYLDTTSDVIYKDQYLRLPDVLKTDRIEITKEASFKEKLRVELN